MRKILSLVICVGLLSACHLPALSLKQQNPTQTASSPGSVSCVYSWTTQPLPDLTNKLQNAMQAAGLNNVQTRAESYGENCLNDQTNQVISFTSMETDFYLSVSVNDLTLLPQMGSLLEKILVVLDGFPPENTPGPQPGLVLITFHSGSDHFQLSFPISEGESARRSGLHGADLLERLQKP